MPTGIESDKIEKIFAMEMFEICKGKLPMGKDIICLWFPSHDDIYRISRRPRNQ